MPTSSDDDPRSPASKLATLHNDLLVAKQHQERLRRGAAYSELVGLFDDGAAARGGRYAIESRLPATEVPRQPPNSPWSVPEILNGPDPLGFSIEAMEPVGEPHEIAQAEVARVGASVPCADALAVTDTVEPPFEISSAKAKAPVSAASSRNETFRRRF
jgi:hypothetical protein